MVSSPEGLTTTSPSTTSSLAAGSGVMALASIWKDSTRKLISLPVQLLVEAGFTPAEAVKITTLAEMESVMTDTIVADGVTLPDECYPKIFGGAGGRGEVGDRALKFDIFAGVDVVKRDGAIIDGAEV